MRKNKTFFGVLLLMAAMSVSACTMTPMKRSSMVDEPGISSIESPSIPEIESKIRQIYQLYLASGGTLSYEEWLESVRGEKGDPGHSP